MRLLINGHSAKTGGGYSILQSLLSRIGDLYTHIQFIVVVSPESLELQTESNNVSLLSLPKIFNNKLFLPYLYSRHLPRLIRSRRIDAVLNLADVPIKTQVRQIMLFDWAYAAFIDSVAWKMMDVKSYVIRRMKLKYFRKYLRYVDIVAAQTPEIKLILENLYGLENVVVIPNSLYMGNIEKSDELSIDFDGGYKLLYLTYYYPHKNMEILIPVAEKVKNSNRDIKFICSIDASQHRGAKEFLKAVNRKGLDKIILNIGPVESRYLRSLYAKVDGVIIPTLLESFSGAYIEAMYYQKTIYTSNLPFATGVCGEAAVYFDPQDPKDIFDKITYYSKEVLTTSEKKRIGKDTVSEMLSWDQCIIKYIDLATN